MNQIPVADLLALPLPERLHLVEELWNSIAKAPENLAVSDVQKKELDRRLAIHRADPASAASWETVKERIRGA